MFVYLLDYLTLKLTFELRYVHSNKNRVFLSVLLIGKEENCALHNFGSPEESKCSIFDCVLRGKFSLALSVLWVIPR
jgi:hypothetical protein